MACSPATGHPLTLEQRSDVARLEEVIDMGLAVSSPAPVAIVPLHDLPAPAVQAELRYRFLSAGWSKVIFHKRASDGAAVVELHAYHDVRLGKEST